MGAPASGIVAEAVLTPRDKISNPVFGPVLFRRNEHDDPLIRERKPSSAYCPC